MSDATAGPLAPLPFPPPDISLTLPLPPSANALWRYDGDKPHISAAYRSWMKAAGQHIMVQGAGDRVPYQYVLRIVLPESRMDCGNAEKAVSDCLQKHSVVRNDRHARRIVIDVDPLRDRDSVLVELWALPGDPPPASRRRRTPDATRLSATSTPARMRRLAASPALAVAIEKALRKG